MLEKIKTFKESNPKLRKIMLVVMSLLVIGSLFSFFTGFKKLNANYGDIHFIQSLEMDRDTEAEDYDEDSTVCDVAFVNGDAKLIVSYSYEEYEDLDIDSITGYEYQTDNGTMLYFDHQDPTAQEVQYVFHQTEANALMPVFNLGIALLILFVSVWIMYTFAKAFTTYEKCWFLTIMVLATIVAVAFPEDSANGVNAINIIINCSFS